MYKQVAFVRLGEGKNSPFFRVIKKIGRQKCNFCVELGICGCHYKGLLRVIHEAFDQNGGGGGGCIERILYPTFPKITTSEDFFKKEYFVDRPLRLQTNDFWSFWVNF